MKTVNIHTTNDNATTTDRASRNPLHALYIAGFGLILGILATVIISEAREETPLYIIASLLLIGIIIGAAAVHLIFTAGDAE